MAGIGLFTLASLLGGMARARPAARGGPCRESAPPSSRNRASAITTTFPAGPPRNRAFAVYAAMSGRAPRSAHSGGALPRCRGVDAVHQHPDRHPAHLVGAPIPWRVSAAARSLRPACALVGTRGWSRWSTALPRRLAEWTSPTTIALLVVGVGLLVAFLVIDSRVNTVCCRCGSWPSHWALSSSRCSSSRGWSPRLLHSLFVTGPGYDPLQAGFAFLPFSTASSSRADRLRPRLAGRPALGSPAPAPRYRPSDVGLYKLTIESTYLNGLLPWIIVTRSHGFAFVRSP